MSKSSLDLLALLGVEKRNFGVSERDHHFQVIKL